MRITQWGEYGVHCLMFIGEQQKNGAIAVNAADIAAAHEIALDYAQQILQRLRKAGLIVSMRGPSGGYKLGRTADQITLKDILTASEGDTFEVICETKPIHPEKCSSDGACSLRSVWFELKDHVNTFLTSKTLESLIQAKPNLGSNTVQINKTLTSQV